MNLELEEYIQQLLKEEEDSFKNLPYTNEQLKEILRENYEFEQRAPKLEFKLKPQLLDLNTVRYYLPEKWEMPRKGKLLFSDLELQRVLRLIVYNLGIEKSLDIIPREMIKQYLYDKKC